RAPQDERAARGPTIAAVAERHLVQQRLGFRQQAAGYRSDGKRGGSADQGTGSPDQGTGSPDQGTGSPDQGTGSPDQGIEAGSEPHPFQQPGVPLQAKAASVARAALTLWLKP